MNRFISAIGLALLLSLALVGGGCAGPHVFPTPSPSWKTHVGQLKYSTPTRSIIGDVVVRSLGNEQFQLSFSSGPGFPLLDLKMDGEDAEGKGALAIAGRWRSWTKLRDAFLAMPAGATELNYENPASHERFSFRFAR